MALISVVIPTYNHEGTVERAVNSVLEGNDVEVIVSDDGSTDATTDIVRSMASADPRIRLLPHTRNQGTLLNRKDGVMAASGRWIMLMDADDEMAEGSMGELKEVARSTPAQIIHFGAEVVAETPEAALAARDMERHLAPPDIKLQGNAILQRQFSEDGGIDWCVHHRLFDGGLLRRAYRHAADEFLILADDIYLVLIADSLAHSYRGLADSRWYRYHLGAGETLKGKLSIDQMRRWAESEACALRLGRSFAQGPHAPRRSDWEERLADYRDRLVFHTMNEWRDNLPQELKGEGLTVILKAWAPLGSVASITQELWRFLRDDAYGLWTAEDLSIEQRNALQKQLLDDLARIERIERARGFSAAGYPRHETMKSAAMGHLRDLGLVEEAKTGERNLEIDTGRKVGPWKALIDRWKRH